MIPASIKNALRRDDADQSVDRDPVIISQQDHDLIVRYALVGIFLILATASLSLTKAVTLPVTAGLVFGLVLGPPVDRLVRAGVPQGLAAGLLVGAGALALSAVVTLFAVPFALWSDRLPGMALALRTRLAGLMVYARQIEGMAGDLASTTTQKVAVADGSPLLDIAVSSSAAAGSMLIFTATIYFYLVTRRHLKARILRLCFGRNARQSAGVFLERVETKVATYFGVVTLINLAMALVAAVIAALAGLPFPLFWGVIAFILNYVALIGPLIMTALLLGAGLMDEGTLWQACWPALVYFLAHLFEGNVVTPLAVGRRLMLSPFLVFIMFVFWLWLWGPVGAILSTPLLLIGTLAVEALSAYRQAEEADSGTATGSA